MCNECGNETKGMRIQFLKCLHEIDMSASSWRR